MTPINFNFLFIYLEKEEISIDKEEFKFQVQSNPEYPSLLAIADTLAFFNIENAALRVEQNEIDLLPNRFIALIKEQKNESNLYFIERKDESFDLINDKKNTTISLKQLQERWLDVVLFIEKEDEIIKKGNNFNFFYILFGLLVAVLFIFKSDLYTNLFLIFPILGISFSIAALKDLFGAKSEIINNLCNITSSTSCESVVKSNKWKLFEYLNFSDLSIVFFCSQLVGLLIAVFSNSTYDFFSFQKLILILASPLIFVSVYFQKFVEKKWCPICLLIISLIIIEIIYFYNLDLNYSIKNILLFGFIYFSIHCFWSWIKSILSSQKELKEFQIKSNRFQRSYTIFKNNLLAKNKTELPYTPIILGNRNSKTVITIITSPFCGHCVKVHEIIDKIKVKHFEDLQINIIIKTDLDSENEEIKDFFRSLLSAYLDQGEQEFIDKLKEWFANKDIKEWLLKNKSENKNTMKIDAIYSNLNTWCKENNFSYTPAIFINGYEYPDLYERGNLEIFIKDIIEDEF